MGGGYKEERAVAMRMKVEAIEMCSVVSIEVVILLGVMVLGVTT